MLYTETHSTYFIVYSCYNAYKYMCFYCVHVANHIVQSEAVESAMLKVDRGNYSSFNPYYDSPQSIGKESIVYTVNFIEKDTLARSPVFLSID